MCKGTTETLAGYADSAGCVEILTAGYPCQPFSNAARGRNNATDLWPEAYRIIRLVRPTWIVLENVPGGGLEHIEQSCSDLESQGYAVWPLDIAVEIRNHVRRRCWIVAHAHGDCESQRPINEKASSVQEAARRWRDQPEPMGMDDGLPGRMDRMIQLGNAIEPAVAEIIFRSLPGAGRD